MAESREIRTHSDQSQEICMKAARDLLVTLLNMQIQYKMFCKHTSKRQDTREYSNILQLLYLTSTKHDTSFIKSSLKIEMVCQNVEPSFSDQTRWKPSKKKSHLLSVKLFRTNPNEASKLSTLFQFSN